MMLMSGAIMSPVRITLWQINSMNKRYMLPADADEVKVSAALLGRFFLVGNEASSGLNSTTG